MKWKSLELFINNISCRLFTINTIFQLYTTNKLPVNLNIVFIYFYLNKKLLTRVHPIKYWTSCYFGSRTWNSVSFFFVVFSWFSWRIKYTNKNNGTTNYQIINSATVKQKKRKTRNGLHRNFNLHALDNQKKKNGARI